MSNWKKRQQENKLSDEQLSTRVKKRISQWQNHTEYYNELKAASDADQESMQAGLDSGALVEGSPKHRRILKELEEGLAAMADVQAQIDEMDVKLASDMDRLVRDAEKIRINTERLRKSQFVKKGGEPATATAAGPAATTTVPAAADTPAEPAPAATADEAGTVASVPFMITSEMQDQLAALGYSETDINALKPEEAGAILAAGTQKTPAAAATAAAATEPPAAAATPAQAAATASVPARQKAQNNVPKKETPTEGKKRNGWQLVFGIVLAAVSGTLIGGYVKSRGK
jgi:hypothetical protein